MAEDMLKDELDRVYGTDREKMEKITMNKAFKIHEGIYVMRVPDALLYIIGDHVERVNI